MLWILRWEKIFPLHYFHILAEVFLVFYHFLNLPIWRCIGLILSFNFLENTWNGILYPDMFSIVNSIVSQRFLITLFFKWRKKSGASTMSFSNFFLFYCFGSNLFEISFVGFSLNWLFSCCWLILFWIFFERRDCPLITLPKIWLLLEFNFLIDYVLIQGAFVWIDSLKFICVLCGCSNTLATLSLSGRKVSTFYW